MGNTADGKAATSWLAAIKARFYLKQELVVPPLCPVWAIKSWGECWLVAICRAGMGLGRWCCGDRQAGTYRSNTKKKKVLDS